MSNGKRIIAGIFAAVFAAGITGCAEEQPQSSGAAPAITTSAATTTDPDENAATDRDIKELETSSYTPDGNAGTVKFLGYYDIRDDQKGTEQCLVFESEQYGGTIEYITCGSGDAYFEKLGMMISADESPDIVTHDAMSYPGNVGKGLFEALDDYIDMDSPLWVGMKDVIESLEYKGKHYKYPHKITTSFALNYSKKTIEENGLRDPYELYLNGEWTWDAWRDLMIEFCDKDEQNIGFYATDTILTSLIATTGTTLVEAYPDGTIINNIGSTNVGRAMNFYETLCRDGVMYAGQLDSWVPPQTFAVNSDRLLFLGMEPEWTYTAATKEIQDKQGVENDILNTVSDFAFVPFPRDSSADAYYQSHDIFGFVIPKGAKNIKGAVDMINCFRVYETDPNVVAQNRADHVSPEPITYTEGKYAGQQRWQMIWDEELYDLWQDMCDPTKFELITEDAFGFSSDFWAVYADILNATAFNGESWTQKSAEVAPVIEAALDEYRS